MDKASGLGRGLGSLIPNKNIAADSPQLAKPTATHTNNVSEQVVDLLVEKITPNPDQPRTQFDADDLRGLMDSIKEHGVIQPIIVSPLADGWQLIAGERRWRAVKELGQSTIPAIVRDTDNQKRLEVALVENLQRKDLNVLETATVYERLMSEFNLSPVEVGRKVGKSRPVIVNTIRILGVEEPVKDAIKVGKISSGHARVLAGLPPEDQLALLDEIINLGLTTKATEEASQEIVAAKNIRSLKKIDPEITARIEQLQRSLGTKVEIKKHDGAGQVVIKFFSDEEFNSLMDKIGN
jgi:ParB family transcriptional regulator, chromosome partitioning protein